MNKLDIASRLRNNKVGSLSLSAISSGSDTCVMSCPVKCETCDHPETENLDNEDSLLPECHPRRVCYPEQLVDAKYPLWQNDKY